MANAAAAKAAVENTPEETVAVDGPSANFKTVTLVNHAGEERVATTLAEQVAYEFDGFSNKANVEAAAKARAAAK